MKARRRRQRHKAIADRNRRPIAANLFNLNPKRNLLRLYEDLTKARSSILTQAKTGKIGLNAFLYQRKVLDVDSPLCRCESAPETVPYIIINCLEYEELRDKIRSLQL